MRNRVKGMASSTLRRAMTVLLALSLLGALAPVAPAFAFTAAQANAAPDCCAPAAVFFMARVRPRPLNMPRRRPSGAP